MKKTILGLAAAFAMAVPSFSMAALVSGSVTYDYSSIYSGTSEDLTYDANDARYSSDLPVLLICIDHRTQPPFSYIVPTTQFDTKAGASAIKGTSGAAGEAAIYWLLDQYYLSHFKGNSVEKRRALQHALWEIGNDYDGTADSIDVAAGYARPAFENVTEYGGSDQRAFIAAYEELYAAMRSNLPALPRTYRSSTYTMDLFRNRDPVYQNMVALIERAPPVVTAPVKPTPVPSLDQWALMALMSTLALFGMARVRQRRS